MSQSLSRRRWLKWAGTAAVVGGVSVAAYYGLTSPTMPATTTTIEAPSTASVYSTPTTSLATLTDYLKSNGVSTSVADMASDYGTLDTNKRELGDLIINIKEEEDQSYPGIIEKYQKNLLGVLNEEDPNDISAERLGTLRYLFSDRSLLINMLEFCMYPGVFDYLDTLTSKYRDVDKRMVYATLGIPRFRQVGENRSIFEAIMQKSTDQQFKPTFDQMLSDGNVDKSKYRSYRRGGYTAFCTPLESLLWELLDSDKKADSFLKHYNMKALVRDAFKNTKASGYYGSEEWDSYDTAANRLGFNSWINWLWMNDNMRYDSKYAEGHGDDRSLEEIYKTKAGVCRHGAYFALHNLKRGAIPVALLAIHLKSPNLSTVGNNDWHAFDVERKSDGFWMIEDLGFPCGMHECSIEGPLQDLNQLVTKVANEGKASVISWLIESTTDVW